MVDWQKLSYLGPPIHGDPGRVEALSQDLNGVASAIEAQLTVLAGIDANEVWDSSAATGFQEAAAELPGLLGKVRTRYAGAADVLHAYAGSLETSVDEMNRWGAIAEDRYDALHEARRAMEGQEQLEQEQQDEVDAWNEANPCEPPRTAEPSRLGQFRQDVDDASQALEEAFDRINEAVDVKDEAGDTARDELAEINDDDLENDRGLFEGIARWVSDTLNLPAFADLLRIVTSIISIAALLLCWVPVLGPLLGAVALVLNVVLLLVDTVLAVSGQGSWWNVAASAFAVATGGLGRAASVGARGAAHAYRFAAGSRAAGDGFRFAPHGVALANRGGVMTRYPASARPTTTSWGAYRTQMRPWANFSEIGDNVRTVRNGRNLPSLLGGHQPGYWNTFRANGANWARNWTFQGGPGAFGHNALDAGRRLGVTPSTAYWVGGGDNGAFSGDPTRFVPNPGEAVANYGANGDRAAARDHADNVAPIGPTPAPVGP